MSETPDSIKGTLLGAGARVSIGTLLSRGFGLVRDLSVAGLLGAGPLHDAFVLALRIPNLFRRFVAEGAFSQALVPLLVECRQRHGVSAMAELAGRFGAALLLVLLGLILSLEWFAEWLIVLVAPGVVGDPERFDPAVSALRIVLPYLLFISLVALGSGVLNVQGRFALAAFAPVIFNVALIIGALWIAPRFDLPLQVLAWSVFAAGVLQLLMIMLPVLRRGWVVLARFRWSDTQLHRLGGLMVPGLIASGIVQGGLLLDTIIVSFLQVGSLTWLYLSDRLVQLAVGVVAFAVGTVLLPALSAVYERDTNPAAFQPLLRWGISWIVVIGCPASVGLVLLAEPIVTTLFQYRLFTATDTIQTALSLRAYAVGLVAFMLVKVVLSAFFARRDMHTPMRVSIGIVAGNLVLSLVLVFWVGLAHAGVALSSSCAAVVHVLVLLVLLRRSGHLSGDGLWPGLVSVLVAGLGMGAALSLLLPETVWWEQLLWYQRVLALMGYIVTGAAVYALLLLLLRFRWRELQSPHSEGS